MNARTSTVALLFALLAAPGCYSYTPIAMPETGMDVRAILETEAAVRRSDGFDDPITRYDGRTVAVTPDSVGIDILIAKSSSQFQGAEIRDTIFLRTNEVRVFQERKLSAVKTALVTVGVGVAAVAIVLGIDAVVGGTGDEPGNGGDPAIRIPLGGWVGSLVPALFGVGHRE